jgi:response regulator of citrate/malate metabolism
MIRVLVVDDDFHVARIHAACVARVDGFTCVGQAHTAADARRAVADLRPDLLLLDIYLPDEDGLSLLRSLHAMDGGAPACIVVTAARDLRAVRSAMQAGAAYYLVKPFGLGALRDQLEAFRRWRDRLAAAGEAGEAGGVTSQATIDQLYGLLHAPPPGHPDPAGPRLAPTMLKVLDTVRAATAPVAAADVAQAVGVSRPTAQRYLADLERRGLVSLHLDYGTTGRPTHRYRPAEGL